MLKRLLLSLMLTTTYAQAKDVEVITRFGPSVLSVRTLYDYVGILNNMQTEYNFKVVHSPGAKGEVADQRGIAFAEQGVDVLVYNSASTYLGKTGDKMMPIQAVATGLNLITLLVNPESTYKDVNEFVNYIRSKEVVYFAAEDGGAGSGLLLNKFLIQHDLKNVKILSYKSPTDAQKAVLFKEADFTIFNVKEMPMLKKIDYDYLLPLSMISVPKSKPEFGLKLKPLLLKACYELEKKSGETALCDYNPQAEIDKLYKLRADYPDNK